MRFREGCISNCEIAVLLPRELWVYVSENIVNITIQRWARVYLCILSFCKYNAPPWNVMPRFFILQQRITSDIIIQQLPFIAFSIAYLQCLNTESKVCPSSTREHFQCHHPAVGKEVQQRQRSSRSVLFWIRNSCRRTSLSNVSLDGSSYGIEVVIL